MSPKPKFKWETVEWVMNLRTDQLPTIDEFGEDDEADKVLNLGPRVQDENWDSKENHRVHRPSQRRLAVSRMSVQEPEASPDSGNRKSLKILRKPFKRIRKLFSRGSSASISMTSSTSKSMTSSRSSAEDLFSNNLHLLHSAMW